MVDAGSQAQQWLMGSGKAVCRVTMTGDSCCAADLAVGLPKIWQPGILLHHAPLPIVEEDPGSSSLISGVGEKRKEEGHVRNGRGG